ncbi:hypothetical protein C8B47_10155, partial [filamentous cyanobacterium CCP4]
DVYKRQGDIETSADGDRGAAASERILVPSRFSIASGIAGKATWGKFCSKGFCSGDWASANSGGSGAAAGDKLAGTVGGTNGAGVGAVVDASTSDNVPWAGSVDGTGADGSGAVSPVCWLSRVK